MVISSRAVPRRDCGAERVRASWGARESVAATIRDRTRHGATQQRPCARKQRAKAAGKAGPTPGRGCFVAGSAEQREGPQRPAIPIFAFVSEMALEEGARGLARAKIVLIDVGNLSIFEL